MRDGHDGTTPGASANLGDKAGTGTGVRRDHKRSVSEAVPPLLKRLTGAEAIAADSNALVPASLVRHRQETTPPQA